MKKRSLSTILCALLAALPLVFQGADMDEDAFLGRPEFKDGRDLGYYIWRDGNHWHVRWTTFGARRHFTGRVLAGGGILLDMDRIDVDAERKVIRPGRPARVVRGPLGRPRVVGGRPPVVTTRVEDHIKMDGTQKVVFNCFTDDDIDGFNFRVGPGVKTLRFLLEIDGKSRADDVEVGKANRNPGLNPFSVRLK